MRAIAISMLLTAIAAADPAANRIEVEVGKTVERDVGVLRGFFCDDASLVDASLVTRGQTNVWIVTGHKAGTTQCRVGDHTRPALVFDVVVKDAR